jgi:hypothetical protein
VIIFDPTGKSCYCCCGSINSSSNKIAIDQDQIASAEEIQVGDSILVADDESLQSWSKKPARFSSGAGGLGIGLTFLTITFEGKNGPQELLALPRQLLLMPDRKLKQASKLVPGEDKVLLQDGSPAQVLKLSASKPNRHMHQIATSVEPASSLAGHLLLTQSVVSGDYSLQIADLEQSNPKLLADGHTELPDYGTKKYLDAHRQTIADSSAVKYSAPVPIPDFAGPFVTEKQSENIQKNAPHGSADQAMVDYLFNLFSGFYPDVTFYVDTEKDIPDAYSWIANDVSIVVVTEELLKIEAIKFESLAFIIARQLGYLYGGPPKNLYDYTCTGAADYAAMAAIIPYVWYGETAKPIIDGALEQIPVLFDYIKPKNRKGKPGDTCMDISTDCRLQAMQAGADQKPLPVCAGGEIADVGDAPE